MSVAGDIKKDLAFLRGILRALRLVTPMARNKSRTFPDVAEELAIRYGERPALLSERETLTYAGFSRPGQPLRPLGAGQWRRQRRCGLPADAQPAGISGDLAGHRPRRRGGGAAQHQPCRQGAGPLHQHRRGEARHRRRRAPGGLRERRTASQGHAGRLEPRRRRPAVGGSTRRSWPSPTPRFRRASGRR